MDEDIEAEDNTCEILKVLKSLGCELHLCDYTVLRATQEITEMQHSQKLEGRFNE